MVEPAHRNHHDYAPAARRLVSLVVLASLIAAVAFWAWQQPFLAYARTMWELSRMEAPASLPVPVEGVEARRIADTFGAPRGRDRQHAGVDIFADRGTPVVSTTRGVVTSVREGGLGGRQVWVLGPGRERHYYAHLDDWAPGLEAGDVVWPGHVLGEVGDTGNARGTPPHLHYAIYGADGATDPLPRLERESAQAAEDPAPDVSAAAAGR
ncbi:MAG: M23 family metallopeptidase [Pseudomonadota bacterium]|nr:M23 family metallopeptidase [Pseudomonadota bacterium]